MGDYATGDPFGNQCSFAIARGSTDKREFPGEHLIQSPGEAWAQQVLRSQVRHVELGQQKRTRHVKVLQFGSQSLAMVALGY